MITIFNREQLYITFAVKEQYEIRQMLSSKGIGCYIKVRNCIPDRGRTGSLGINMDYAYEYTIYVHKKDFDLAKAVTGLSNNIR
ncbi:MAG: hypothetical protein VB095_11595 [Anaerovorax sp.]|nr:hypothetical protein [Anaerovorax sp.]